jgi:hypothetical protein
MQDVKATIEFTSAQVKEILVQYVKANYPLMKEAVKDTDITFSVSAGFSGGHSGHSSSPSFNSAKVEVRLKQG